LNISQAQRIATRDEFDLRGQGECSKKSAQQGRSPFDARSVHPVREHGKRARTPLVAFFNIPRRERRRKDAAFLGMRKFTFENGMVGWRLKTRREENMHQQINPGPEFLNFGPVEYYFSSTAHTHPRRI
jgi:hypothetical protein